MIFCSLARKASFDKGEYIPHIRPVGERSLTPPGGKKALVTTLPKMKKSLWGGAKALSVKRSSHVRQKRRDRTKRRGTDGAT
jgi:hypothetical protein